MTSSIMTFLTLGSGPLVAFLVQKFGHRWITLIGELLITRGNGPLVAFLVQKFGHRWITLIGEIFLTMGK
jgi:hypothetical protein